MQLRIRRKKEIEKEVNTREYSKVFKKRRVYKGIFTFDCGIYGLYLIWLFVIFLNYFYCKDW